MRHLRSSGSKNARASKVPVALGESVAGLARLNADAIREARPTSLNFQDRRCTCPGESISVSRNASPGVFGARGGSSGQASRVPPEVASSSRYSPVPLRALPTFSAMSSFPSPAPPPQSLTLRRSSTPCPHPPAFRTQPDRLLTAQPPAPTPQPSGPSPTDYSQFNPLLTFVCTYATYW